MRLARDSRYAIEALIVLAGRDPGVYVDAREIGAQADLPLAYLHKILRVLATAGVVESRRGKGYSLARPANEITMREVLEAVEGDGVFDGRCIFWREECSVENPCALHFRWAEVRPQMEAIATTTIADVDRARALAAAVGGP